MGVVSKATEKVVENKGAWSTVGGGLMSAFFGFDKYDELRESGHGVVGSFLGAAADAGISYAMNPIKYMLFTGAADLGALAVEGVSAISEHSRNLQRQNLNIPFANSTFIDSPQIQTMRQAGLALARQSKMKTQEAMLGNEASHFHR